MGKPGQIALAVFIAAKFFLQYFLIHPVYDLQRDEYLHLDQANHLDWGFLSVPPVTSWIAFLIKLLGNGVFWVKFFPALFGALTIIVVWKTIEALGGNLFAAILGATGVLLSALLRLNTLFQPNSLEVLCWTSFYFVLVKYIATEKASWLYVGAIIFAIGFLNKYNFAFLALGLTPAILLSEHRRLFTRKELYLAVGLALVLIFPNLAWQYTNNFPVVHHMQELAQTQLVHVNRFDFLKSQGLFFLGAIIILLSALYALVAYPPFYKYRLFFWSLVFTLAFFMYFKAKDYYAIGIYPIYIAFGAVFLEKLTQKGRRKILQPLLLAMPILLFIPLYKIGFPNKSPETILQNPTPYQAMGLLRWEDGKDHALPQDFADMVGWKELAILVDSISLQLPNPENCFLLCDNYGEAGAINYYSTNKLIRANSFNADYINWMPLDQKIVTAILVKEAGDEDPERTVEKPFFDTVYLAAKRVNPFAREREISIYVLKGAKIDVNARLKEERDRKKY